jgi:hypothetical protein
MSVIQGVAPSLESFIENETYLEYIVVHCQSLQVHNQIAGGAESFR